MIAESKGLSDSRNSPGGAGQGSNHRVVFLRDLRTVR